MKYNLTSSQTDRMNFDQMCYTSAMYTFDAAPEAWEQFDEELAADVAAQNRYVMEEQGLVDDHEDAEARNIAQMRAAWEEWNEDKTL